MVLSIYDSLGFNFGKYQKAEMPAFDVQPNSIYSLGFGGGDYSTSMTNPLTFGSNLYANDFWKYMSGDFSSTMSLFDAYMSQSLPPSWNVSMFDKEYNIKVPKDIYKRPKVKSNNGIPNWTQKFTPSMENSDLKDYYNPKYSNALANIAEKNAISMKNENAKYKCSKGVRLSLEKAGLSNGEFRAPSAYQGAEQLRHHKNFKEVDVAKEDLKSLPAGCIIVWDPYYSSKGKFQEHGHIGITLGDGKEASDRVADIRFRNSSYSVFVPVGVHGDA